MHKESTLREIRRYRNRRLYDLETAQIIKQRDLGELVRSGANVRVTDFASGKDITVDVLAQVARLEVAGWSNQKEGEDVYRTIIERGSEMSKKAINGVILAGLGALSLTREKAEEIIDSLITRGKLESADRKVAVDDLIAKAEEQARKFSSTMKQQATKWRGVKREEYDALKDEVSQLRSVIDKLEARLQDQT